MGATVSDGCFLWGGSELQSGAATRPGALKSTSAARTTGEGPLHRIFGADSSVKAAGSSKMQVFVSEARQIRPEPGSPGAPDSAGVCDEQQPAASRVGSGATGTANSSEGSWHLGAAAGMIRSRPIGQGEPSAQVHSPDSAANARGNSPQAAPRAPDLDRQDFSLCGFIMDTTDAKLDGFAPPRNGAPRRGASV